MAIKESTTAGGEAGVNGFSWLNDLMTWLAKWVPRLVPITARNRAIVFRPGGAVTEHGAGLLVYWPIIHTLSIVSVQLRTMELAAQVHGQEIVQIIISWRITDPRLALLTLNDVVATMDDWAASALASVHAKEKSNDAIAAETTARLADRMRPHGIQVCAVQVSQRGWALPIKQLNDWAVHEARQLAGDMT